MAAEGVITLRAWRRSSQAQTRRLCNALQAAVDLWEEGHLEGEQALGALSNATLNERYVAHLPLGALSKVEGVQAAARQKLLNQQRFHQQTLEACLSRLQAAVANIRKELTALHSQMDQAGAFDKQPLFAALNLQDIEKLLQHLHTVLASELVVKSSIIKGIHELQGSAQDKTTQAKHDMSPERLRTIIEVYIAAWKLQPEFDPDVAAEVLSAIAMDMA